MNIIYSTQQNINLYPRYPNQKVINCYYYSNGKRFFPRGRKVIFPGVAFWFDTKIYIKNQLDYTGR